MSVDKNRVNYEESETMRVNRDVRAERKKWKGARGLPALELRASPRVATPVRPPGSVRATLMNSGEEKSELD